VVYLPAIEFFLSLHVLRHPEHHTSRLAWSKEMAEVLPKKLQERLAYFSAMSGNFLDIMDPLVPWEDSLCTSVEAGLEHYESMTSEAFVEAMIGPVYHREQITAWLKGRTDDRFEQLKPEHRELIRRPAASKREFLEFCHQYLPYFQKEQRRIEPWLIRSVHESQERLRDDPVRFMEEIHPRLHVHDTFLQFHKAKTHTFFYRDLKHIYIKPSTFISPHLMLGIFPERISVALHVEVPGTTSKAAIPQDFIAKMKVFSDPTRVAILKSLLEHPYCIQQLAELHGISEPAVTKHIKLLAEVNFIWGERMLYWRLTGRENLQYFGSLYGLSGAALNDRIDSLLKQVELEEAADTPVERYSKGMKQRLQIARGLINDPKYIFLDEPTLGLDAPIARHLRQHVKSLATEQGKAILLTSHYIHEVEELCDEVYIINKGKLVAHDTPEKLTKALFKESTLRVTIPYLSESLKRDFQHLAQLQRARWETVHLPEASSVEVVFQSEADLTTDVLAILSRHQSPVLRLNTEQPSLEDVILHLAERRTA
jgi:ABC-type multidrug transport system ATPase subunit